MRAVVMLSLLTCVLTTSLCQSECSANERDTESHRVAVSHPGLIHYGIGPSSVKSATDTFYVYGGPGTAEGRFQILADSPGGPPDTQGWTGVDLTEQVPKWHASSILSSSTGDGNPEGFTGALGNHGVISHHDDADYVGYGNNWNDWLVFSFDPSVLDPGFDPNADTTTVRLICEYKHFLEPSYDYLHFEWNQLGLFQPVLILDGNSYNDGTGRYEKRDFDSDDHGGIVYHPGSYARLSIGSEGVVEGVQLRIRVTTDGVWSDEDGLFSTNGFGAAALDNIRVYVNGVVVSLADFEHVVPKDDLDEGDVSGHDNGAGPGTSGWLPTPTIFVGDFSKIFSQFQDIDPCRDNITPAFSFINDGTPPNNAPGVSLPPATSPTWDYGIPAGYVVEYKGGLAGGLNPLKNYIWSPAIQMDLLGPEDDVANGGTVLGFTRYTHLPLINGIFAVWHVRSRELGSSWSNWKDNGFIYYSQDPVWQNLSIDVSEHIPPTADEVQIALGVEDLRELFAFPGDDSTPSPLYDNVYLKKYRIGGPIISARTIDLAQDCFPVDGTLSGSCRFDAAVTVDANFLVPGDSIAVSIVPGVPGSQLQNPVTGGTMFVAHLANPEFAVERAPALASMGSTVTNFDPNTGWPIYVYAIEGEQVIDQWGGAREGRYFFDLLDGTSNGLAHIAPELEWIFPGDVIQYRIESWDNYGNNSQLPEDGGGLGDFGPDTIYPRAFTMRALPTIVEGGQPRILFWNDAGHRAGEDEYLAAFQKLCIVEGRDLDTYTTKGPSSGLSNGLGSAGFRGATPDQLAGYDVLVYALGNLSNFSISDGSGSYSNDLGDDLGTLSAWVNADADRYHVYFGDDFASAMANQGSATQAYLNQVLGVAFLGNDVGPVIDGQVTPVVSPTGLGSGAFNLEYVANGGCLLLNDFDHIGPYVGGSVAAHEFLDPSSIPYPTQVAGSIEWMRVDSNSNTKHSFVFPYDLSFVERPVGGEPPWLLGTTALLQQVLWAFGFITCDVGVNDPIVIPDTSLKFYVRQNHPNPFNPRTRIEFSLPQRGEVRVSLYNVRGERVAVLLDEIREAGPGFVDWNGHDARGAEVASGIYLYKVEAAGHEVIKKMALIR